MNAIKPPATAVDKNEHFFEPGFIMPNATSSLTAQVLAVQRGRPQTAFGRLKWKMQCANNKRQLRVK